MADARLKTILMALVLAMMSGGACLYSQAPQSQVLGIVTDASRAAVPGARVVLRNEATGVQNTTTTTSTGNYTFLYLNSGIYTLTVQKEGFETTVVSGVAVQVLDKRRVDVQLIVGPEATKVIVSGAAAKVDTDSAVVGTTVSQKQATSLLLDGREFSTLALTMPGVQASGTSGSRGITAGASFSTTLSIGGGSGDAGSGGASNAYTYDGVDNTWTIVGGPGINPSVDSIQEFRIDRSQMPAEFGRGNNEIEVVTRGGTNHFHGTLWEYLRNNATSAGEYYTHQVEDLKRNQYGGNLGGPIKKGKAFFFFNWEGQKLVSVNRQQGTVLTPKQRVGDLSEFLALNPSLYQIHDPFTGAAYAGNVIPGSKLDPVSMAFVDTYMPLPTLVGIAHNYLSNFPVTDDWHQGIVRVDYKISHKDQVTLRFAGEPRSPLTAGLSANSEPTTLVSYYYNISTAWQRTWTSSTLTEIRLGYHSEKEIQQDVPRPKWASPNTVGMGDTVPGELSMYPYNVSMASWWFPSEFYFHSYDIVADLTHVRGSHTIKTGFERVTHEWSNPDGPGPNKMYFLFTGIYSGIGVSDFLLGWPQSANTQGYGKFIPTANRGNPFSDAFIQDDWKATRRLTLNVGLRYDLIAPRAERHDLLTSFDPGSGRIVVAGNQLLPQYTNQPLVAANPGLFVTAAQMGWPLDSMVFTPKFDFSPRIGFAWRPWKGNKAVVRGGYGMFYSVRNELESQQDILGSPYQQAANSIVNTTPYPTATIDNPFASTSGVVGLPAAPYWPSHMKDPYMENLSLGVQRELPSGMIAEANFQDQHIIRLDNGVNFNQSQLGVSTSPYPNLQTYLLGNDARKHLRYDSLELILRKNSKHYTCGLSYVWAKEIGSSPLLYVGEIFKGPSNYLPTELKADWVVDIPFGNQRRFLNRGGVVDAIVGGWSSSSSFILHQGGDPLTIATTTDYTLDNQGDRGRPNRVCSGRVSNPTPQEWFNQSCFVAPVAPSWGNSGTGILFGPSKNMQGDFSVFKNFTLHEDIKLQFRTEIFNVFNHPLLNDPGTSWPDPVNFGVINTKSLTPRVLQFALRLSF